MAGFSVTVCLPATAAPDVMAALGAALAPFGETSDSDWDRGWFWDSWRIAGGADGHGFWIAPGREADSRLIHDSPDYRGRAALRRGGTRVAADMVIYWPVVVPACDVRNWVICGGADRAAVRAG
jgi:hypothetical protein